MEIQSIESDPIDAIDMEEKVVEFKKAGVRIYKEV